MTWILQSLGEKPEFSTTFQLHLEVENITSNCKMFFSTLNDVSKLPANIVDNVELNPQHSQSLVTYSCQLTRVSFSTNIEVKKI